MAGGIDWFRWHHGSVTDPKFQLVARKSGARLSDVLAVWAYLLESASQSDARGNFGIIDCEAVDCLFGFDDGMTERILGGMVTRLLIAEGCIVSWEKRQPKRERESDNSTERSRAFRQRQVEPKDADDGNETPRNATQRQETPRGEESREDKEKKEEPRSKEAAQERAPAIGKPDGVSDQTWNDWLQLRKAKRASVTATVIKGAEAEAAKAGVSLEEFLQIWCRRGSQGLEASWLVGQARASPMGKQAALEARNAEAGREAKRLIFGDEHAA